MKQINKITIIGMGALGIMYGEFLAGRLGPEAVTYLADSARIGRYQREGAICNGRRCGFRYQDAAVVTEPAELLIFAVKATALEQSISLAGPHVGPDTVILSVLNGITSEEIIGAALGRELVLGCVAQGMDAVKAGNELTYANLGVLCVGIIDGDERQQERLDAVTELFDRVGLPYMKEADIRHRMWSKWMLNVGVNQVVMVKGGTYGTVQEAGAARELMIAAMAEARQVAELEGVAVTAEDLEGYVNLVDTLSPDGMPSMRQDGLERRYSEVELFAGTVVRKARKYQLAVPVNQMLYDTITTTERGYTGGC